ncbi:MAG: hypothetical protein ABIO70_10340 [Pseudomonadota bacterium]
MGSSREVADPAALADAVAKIRAARGIQRAREFAAIAGAAAACRAAFEPHAARVLASARDRLAQGYPPALRRLCGFGDREVYLNRILGWLFDPTGDHGAGRRPLLALCGLIGFDTLAEDLRSDPSAPELHAERTPDPDLTSLEPDLMVRTRRAALLLENKVGSGESWPGQYPQYLALLRQWAGPRKHRAHLLAPEAREQAEGWSAPLTHAALAEALRPLTLDPDLPRWTRITVALVVADLANKGGGDALDIVRRLVEAAGDSPQPHAIRRISHLLEDVETSAPWMDP